MTDFVDQEIVSENGTVRDGRLLEALQLVSRLLEQDLATENPDCHALVFFSLLFVNTSLLINALKPLRLKCQTYYRNSRGLYPASSLRALKTLNQFSDELIKIIHWKANTLFHFSRYIALMYFFV